MSVIRLNQIIAVEKGVKNRSEQELTAAHHTLLKPDLLSGFERTYRPKDELGDQLPGESKRVQVKAEEESWEQSLATATYATKPVDTTRTKKVPRNHVKAAATAQHPEQVEVYQEDIVVGTWTNIKFSGALPADRVNTLVERVEKLQSAVKFAREEANNTEAPDQKVGETFFTYLFGR